MPPAGCGETTAPVCITIRAVETAIPHFFFLEPGAPLRVGDIEFALRELPGRIILVVDNADRLSEEMTIHSAMRRNV